jgi:hypothetical protein
MTNGDAGLSSAIPPAVAPPSVGQFSDARESYKVDQFQAPPRDLTNMAHFQSQSNSNNNLNNNQSTGNHNNSNGQFKAPSPFAGRDMYQMPSNNRDGAPHHGQGGGPPPPQGPPPRGIPSRYDLPSGAPIINPPRPALQMGQDYSSSQSQFKPQMNIATGMGAGMGSMMGFQQQPQQQQQQYLPQPQHQQQQQPQHLQQQQQPLLQFMPPQQQPLQQQTQSPAMMGMGLGMGMGMNLQQPVLSSVGRGLPLQPPAGPGLSGLGMGMGIGGLPGAYPQPIGRGMPLALPRGPSPAPAPVAVGDPNNEVSSWSEHVAEDKRKYWYNRVNGTSTYDKPFCLKTPEERSIPPCKWKEYTAADGKKYYSDGKESSWTMPEEFRVWKEKMDAVERKKLAALLPPEVSQTALTSSMVHNEHAATAANLAVSSSSAAAVSANALSNGAGMGMGTGAGSSSVGSSAGGSSGAGNKKKQVEEDEPKPVIVYATQEEAVEAFKAMLTERKVSTHHL